MGYMDIMDDGSTRSNSTNTIQINTPNNRVYFDCSFYQFLLFSNYLFSNINISFEK